MIKLIFKNNKVTGYATVGYSSSDTKEIIKEIPEQELTDLLSPLLEEDETWRDKYRYLSLDEDGEVYLDEERYEEEQEEEGE